MSPSHTTDPITEGLEYYQVGGSVRDALLGLPVADRDYVVVGADPETMLARGFRPVGQDFPVFLHPKTHEEYALARLERKQGHGYHGFDIDAGPNVTLEEDLSRRDLTINAMAIDQDGQLIDPFNGRLDLSQGILRHVSEAFREDPVRVLRLARFATRFGEFTVAPSTLALCHTMQSEGELQYLVPERVWAEMAKALMCDEPSRFFATLEDTQALPDIWPELARASGSEGFDHALTALDRSAKQPDSVLAIRFALVCMALSPEAIAPSCERLNTPKACRFWALWAKDWLDQLPALVDRDPPALLAFIQSFDGLRQPKRWPLLKQLANAWSIDASTGTIVQGGLDWTERAMAHIMQMDTQALVAQGLEGPQMAQAIERARWACIEQTKP